MLSHLFDMGRPGIDEGHVLAGGHHVRSAIAADRARSNNRNLLPSHACLLGVPQPKLARRVAPLQWQGADLWSWRRRRPAREGEASRLLKTSRFFADIALMSAFFGRIFAAGVIAVVTATTPGCARGGDRISTRCAAA
jgi:hypothetical protein